MMIISERINGLFRSVGKAIDNKDAVRIQELVRRQEEHGATALDINIGPGRGSEGPEAMKWLVSTVQEVTELPLCIDTPDIKTMSAGLETCNNPVIVNSTTAEVGRMAALFPLAKEHDADIICLTMDERGIPNDAESRAEMAMLMMTTAMDYNIMPDRILLDPLVLPVAAAQDQGWKVIEALRMFRMLNDPAPRTVVGLSNVSNGCRERSLINRTYLAMLMGAGLSAAIMDPEDEETMRTLKTAQVLLDQKLYCEDYLRD
ncbi:MAG: 5-methyltetrahydrofolate corrinoid/iron sulfur protein methyltransferase [Candidatus Methanomethylophilaceae archaeon]|nr:5-methyltetrahydrofolate corrinoid/iron sulfur protein methyltransferase [Candidatus Methanomethylophilaceae archaeon]MDI3541138.1 5-methyltetrahydrofolate corrinoid/iron sulfur protein methyltransferase [Candidatus Methanomethylophilaceae archaeon]HIJ00614.1 dihydropteroate synthase [Candidatus Methanomethylophilaceae archaeon]